MRRTLVLDENDLVMVVKEDVIKQVDENRGEMNRSEFVNYLIQTQLREREAEINGVTREELGHFKQEMVALMNNFLQFFVAYGMAMGRPPKGQQFQDLTQQLDSFGQDDEEAR